MNYYLECFKKYTVFTGRSQRAEYWYFYLFNFIISIALVFLSFAIKDHNFTLVDLYSLVVLLPGLAVSVRRLHDIGKSGWWILIQLIPIIGGIWLIVLFATDGTPGQNQYGSNPKEVVPEVAPNN